MEHLNEGFESPTAGHAGEPNNTSIKGIPICSKCGQSTRNRNRLVCKPCEDGTRLVLTREDREWLRQIGITVPS